MESSNPESNFLPDNLGTKPQTVYKYRVWSDSYHQKIITHRELWLPHPFDLNDFFELRLPTEIRTNDVTSYEAYHHLWNCLVIGMPELSKKERKKLLDLKFAEIKDDPELYFQQGIIRNEAKRDYYDAFGVLSFSTNPLQKLLWTFYANDFKGFCIGFNRIALLNYIKCLDGKVSYSDEPMYYNPMVDLSPQELASSFFQKCNDWQYEEEYRFLTAGLLLKSDRLKVYPAECVSEVILGVNMSEEHQKEIIEEIKKSFGTDIPIYKIKREAKSFKIQKELLVAN